MPDPGDGNYLDGYEMLERVEEFFLRIMLIFNLFFLFWDGGGFWSEVPIIDKLGQPISRELFLSFPDLG